MNYDGMFENIVNVPGITNNVKGKKCNANKNNENVL